MIHKNGFQQKREYRYGQNNNRAYKQENKKARKTLNVLHKLTYIHKKCNHTETKLAQITYTRRDCVTR